MDLLKGYGSDDSSSSSSSSSSKNEDTNANPKMPPATAKAATVLPTKITTTTTTSSKSSLQTKKKRGGKRILSLGAVLPPEIFDRLTRPPEEDDSSASSLEGNGAAQSKKRKRHAGNNDDKLGENSKRSGVGGGDRSEVDSLLNELRATPLHALTEKKTKSKNSVTGNKVDAASGDVSKNDSSGKLGMAFMSFTSSTTKTEKKGNHEVVDVHAVKQSASPKTSEAMSTQQNIKPRPAAQSIPSFSRMSGAAPVAAASFKRSVPQYAQASSMPQYPVTSQHDDTTYGETATTNTTEEPSHNINNNTAPKSRKQKREEERLLRSGAFQNSAAAATTTHAEIHQPSPTEFAPTAHAAAIASKAARARGVAAGGGGSVKNIAMYDPKSGTDVKGLGVTGKHRSKHQINQLMASAISLEAHRASEAELARFGMGGSGAGGGQGSRADAKKKYGW